MEYYNNSFVDVRIYVKRLPWFWFMKQALYNTLTCNLLLRIKAVFQIRKIVLRTESKSLSGAIKMMLKLAVLMQKNKMLEDFSKKFCKEIGPLITFSVLFS